MITCPSCQAPIEAAEVYTVHGLTGTRYHIDCPECPHTFEVEIAARDTAPTTPKERL